MDARSDFISFVQRKAKLKLVVVYDGLCLYVLANLPRDHLLCNQVFWRANFLLHLM